VKTTPHRLCSSSEIEALGCLENFGHLPSICPQFAVNELWRILNYSEAVYSI
jgi:hypothetical protein